MNQFLPLSISAGTLEGCSKLDLMHPKGDQHPPGNKVMDDPT